MFNDLRWKSFIGKRHFFACVMRAALIVSALTLIVSGLWGKGLIKPARGAAVTQNLVPVASVSAASFVGSPAPLAPNSIVAAFGTQLATGTQLAPSQPLPTTLNGTTVTVNGTAAPLFFVSSGQVNYLAPPNLAVGDAQVVITSTLANGDQVVSRGQMKVATAAPALFTANSSGVGAPAALTGRVTAGGDFVFDPNPPYEADPLHPGQVVPAPVDVGTNERPAFFVLFGTGLRNAGNVRAIIGGVEVAAAPVAAPGFTGLDQINVQIPVSLKGSGIVEMTLVANGVSSNAVNVNLAGTPNNTLSITGFSVTDPALVGQTINIQGNGFSPTVNQNIVRFGGAEARVIAATASQLTVIIPFGAESGRVTVQTTQGEARSSGTFRVRTSISGIVQSTGSVSSAPAPLEGVTVRLVGANLSVRTNPQGSFVLPDLAPGGALVEVDGGTNNTNPPFPRVTLKTTVRPDRDNQFVQPISLQQINGGSGNVGGGPGVTGAQALATRGAEIFAALKQRELTTAKEPAEKEQTTPGKTVTISNRGVTLEIPIGTGVRFPDGKTSGQMQLTVIEKSRLPGITIPVGIYSSNIAQITPLGLIFSPGASLSFPNPDQTNLGPGAKVDLFRYDFINGAFIKRGTGTVSADRTKVVSDGRIVDLASFWFAGATTGVTTVTGRVIDGLGFPVSGATVEVNGRAARSDQNGGFSIPDVATAGVAQVQAEAVVPQQFGAPPRGTSSLTNVVAGGVTNVGTIALSNTNQAGLVLSPFVVDFASNAPPAKLEVTLTQPAPAGGLTVALSSDNSAVAAVPANATIPGGQTTASFNVTRGGPGVALISARASLNGNSLETIAIVTVARSGPTLASVAPNSAAVGATITISGSGLSSTADNNYVFFVRNGVIVGLPDPDQNQIVIDSQNRPALRVKAPGISAGAVSVVVAVIDDVTGVFTDPSAPIAFNVTASAIAAPRLTSVAPTSGKPRDQLRLNGSGFGPAPRDNRVVFNQSGQISEARILLAGSTQLIIEVPGFNLTKGSATIYAERIDANGAPSNQSNLLDFTITADAAPPARPSITQVLNAQTGARSGRDGETIRVLGTNFGTNYYIPDTDSLFSDLPFITILLFYQNNQLVNFAIPNNALDGNQLTALIPTGLNQGPVQITAATFDLETGLISDESLPFQDFSITIGSVRRIDEGEPNDSPGTATQVSIPLIVDGRAAVGDFASLSIQFDDGTTERLHDLFFLPLDKTTAMTVTLNFSSPADLDLFILQRNADGGFSLIGASTRKQSTIEQLGGSLPAGNYFIAVGAYSGSSRYSLSLTAGAGATAVEAGEMKKAVEVKR